MEQIIKEYKRRVTRLKNEKLVKYKGKITRFKEENVKLAIEYLEHREDYLKKVNGTGDTARKRYFKTLGKEITYLQNVLYWFNKWNLKDLTKDNIEEVFNKIEEDKLRSIKGNSLKDNTKKDYYSKVLKNGFFNFIKKDDLAKEVIIRKFTTNEEVRFFEFETLIRLTKAQRYKDHELLLWLMFDTGVEINAILQLRKNDFSLEKTENNDDYYTLHVREEIGKKRRSVRNIFIYHNRTNELLNEILKGIGDTENLFKFKWRNAYNIINETSKTLNLKLKTHNQYITPKDFRSSCATYFLKEGWTTDEIKARLGHKPSSSVIDRYVSYLSLDQQKLKKKKEEVDIKNYKEKYSQIAERNRQLEETIKSMNKDLENIKKFISENNEIKNAVKEL